MGVPSRAFGVGQELLAVLSAPGFPRHRHRGAGGTFAYENDAPLACPSAEPNAAFQCLTTVATVLPECSLAHHAGDEILHLGGVAQFEQIGQRALLTF